VRCREVVVEHRLGLDDGLEFGVLAVGRVDDVDPRGALARDDQVSPLEPADVTRRGAGVPPEVVELVAAVGHLHPVDDLRVAVRIGVDVHHGEEVVRVDVGADVESHHVRELLGLGLLDGRLRRRVPGPLVVVVVVVTRCGAVGTLGVAHVACRRVARTYLRRW